MLIVWNNPSSKGIDAACALFDNNILCLVKNPAKYEQNGNAKGNNREIIPSNKPKNWTRVTRILWEFLRYTATSKKLSSREKYLDRSITMIFIICNKHDKEHDDSTY